MQLTHPAPNDHNEMVETWLFSYEETEKEKFGYMTLNFSNLLSGCKISICGTDGLAIENIGVDESLVQVCVSDFETLNLAEYVEMTSVIHKSALQETVMEHEEEAFCFPMPDFGKLAKDVINLRN